MAPADSPVVVFDSGLGGISVLRALVRTLPEERFVYFGDSANAPYGTRPAEEIQALTLANLDRLDREYHFKAAVIACNTATSVAIGALRSRYADRPVIGIEPALKLAADRHPGGTVVVMATQTTLREEKFARLTRQYRQNCRVISLPCPELVEFVERGELDGPAVTAYLSHRLGAYLAGGADAVVLGCTHFPFAAPVLRRLLPPSTELLDGSLGTAQQTRRLLEQAGLLAAGRGEVLFLNSCPDPALEHRACQMLEMPSVAEIPGFAPCNPGQAVVQYPPNESGRN